MDTSLRKLTLAAPKAIQASILEVLDNLTPLLQGYSFHPAQGRGPSAELKSGYEKVQGATNVVMILIILPEAQISGVLNAILTSHTTSKMSYWIEPVLDFGRLQ